MKTFNRLRLPDNRTKLIPDDILLRFPTRISDPAIAIKLAEIPWDEAYGQKIPKDLRGYWDKAFGHLHVRTTDVHTAVCLGMMEEFLSRFDPGFYDPTVIGVGIIFHDCGWSTLSPHEIAASLGVSGLVLTSEAIGPKEAHLNAGRKMAEDELKADPYLSDTQKEIIFEIIGFHDFPERASDATLSFKIACDLDHLWSFTHENFWQDTVRKDIDPHEYWENLKKDLDGYFLTEQGRKMAHGMLLERRDELAVYDRAIRGRL